MNCFQELLRALLNFDVIHKCKSIETFGKFHENLPQLTVKFAKIIHSFAAIHRILCHFRNLRYRIICQKITELNGVSPTKPKNTT